MMMSQQQPGPEEVPKFTLTSDSVYEALKGHPPAFDKDTISMRQQRINPIQNGAATVAQGGLAGLQSSFAFTADNRIRWDTSALVLDLVMTAADKTVGNCTANIVSVPWDLIGLLISEIKLRLNGTQIWSCADGFYRASFVARALRHYSIKALEQKNWVFGPIQGDKRLLIPFTAGAKYDGDVLLAGATYVKATRAAGPPIADTLEDASAAATAYFHERYGTGGAAARSARWIGSDSGNRVLRVSIPFAELFPRVVGVISNFRKAQIDITWTTSRALLERAHAAAGGFVHITQAFIQTDEYVPSPLQVGEDAVDKKYRQAPDVITFMDAEVTQERWVGGDITRVGIANLDAVMAFQFASDVSPKVGVATYASPGQLLFLAGGQDAGAGDAQWAETNARSTNGTPVGPRTMQIFYGTACPTDPLEIVLPSAADGYSQIDYSGLYRQYLSAFGRVTDREHEEPMSYELFSRTMTFAYLRPWAPGTAHLSREQALSIRFTGAPQAAPHATTPSTVFFLVLFIAKQWRLNVDGSVTPVEMK